MDFYNLMNEFKCDKTEDYTHVSMLPHGGLYRIPDDKIEAFYGKYSLCMDKKAKFGILERPTDIGPMLVDIDIVKKSKTLISLHTKERTIEYAKCFQNFLLETTNLESVDCWVLEKKPYLDGKGNCKNGFHLHFPFVWMSRVQRSFITQLVKDTCIEQEFETLDDSAVRNNWFLYGSRKTETQGSYRVRYVVETDGAVVKRRSRNTYVKTLSIRYNSSKIATSITNGRLPKNIVSKLNPKPIVPLDDSLLSRCMESLDSSRADDYHDWIKIGCILYTIDKENGFQRWDNFSKQSYKYDEDYLTKTWSRFKDYNYTLGSLIYLAREDDNKFSIKKVYTRRELLEMCRDKGLKAFTSKSVSELCNLLCLPPQERDVKRSLRKAVTLTNVETNEKTTFKSIYSAAKFVGRNPGSISSKKNTGKIIKSVFDNAKYTVEIKV